MEIKTELAPLIDILHKTKRVVVLTGAGISAESGIPTFRGEEGLWKTYRAEELATLSAFSKDPRLVWEWYDWRRGIIGSKDFNPGHQVLASWEKLFPAFHVSHRTSTVSIKKPVHITSWNSTETSGNSGVPKKKRSPKITAPPSEGSLLIVPIVALSSGLMLSGSVNPWIHPYSKALSL